MKIKSFILSIFILSLNLVSAQFTHQYKGKASLSFINKTITKVVLTEDEEFNKVLRQAIKDYWKQTKVEFITEKQLSSQKPNDKYTYIYFNDFNVKDQKKTLKALALTKFASLDNLTFLNNALAYVSLDSKSMEQNWKDVSFRLPHLVKQLNDIVQIVWDNNLKASDAAAMRSEIIKAYKEKAWKLKNKTLLVDVNYLAMKIVDKEEILAKYKYSIEFVAKTEIQRAIETKDASKAYLISAENLYKINSVTDCATGEILFANFVEENPGTFQVSYLFDATDAELLYTAVKKSKEPSEKLSKEDKMKAKEEKKKNKGLNTEEEN